MNDSMTWKGNIQDELMSLDHLYHQKIKKDSKKKNGEEEEDTPTSTQ